MWAPRDAVALLSVFGRKDGMNEITYACSDGSRKMVLEVADSPTLVQRMWDMLDETMSSLMNPPGDPEKRDLKIRARAQAEFIAMFMKPHFTTADMIAVEARRRYNARQEGTPEYDPEYETPGLGTRRYEPPPGTPRFSRDAKPESTKKTAAPKAKASKPLPPEAIPGAKMAIESGKFTVAQIAQMYSVSEEAVRTAVGS